MWERTFGKTELLQLVGEDVTLDRVLGGAVEDVDDARQTGLHLGVVCWLEWEERVGVGVGGGCDG